LVGLLQFSLQAIVLDLMCKFSVVIPFYNEESNLPSLLVSLKAQSVQPNEYIFVDSLSSDNSVALINKWISDNNFSNVTILKDVDKTPATAKNQGILYSSFAYIIFLDCGLDFDSFLFENCLSSISDSSIGCYGSFGFHKTSYLDTVYSLIAFNYNNGISCIPGGIYNVSLFKIIGLFKPYRAGYDRYWRKDALKLNLKIKSLNAPNLFYSGVNFSDNFLGLLHKFFFYRLSGDFLRSTFPLSLLSFSVIFLFYLFPLSFVFYLLLRYFLTLKKSTKFLTLSKIFYYTPGIIFLIPILDIIRVLSFALSSLRLSSFVLKQLKRV